MSAIHWRILRLRVVDGVVTPTDEVAEVRAADGAGTLRILDESARETLEELFTEEQIAFIGREVEEGGVETTVARILQPWQPETLEYVRTKLGRNALTAVEV